MSIPKSILLRSFLFRALAALFITASAHAVETLYSFQLGPRSPQAGLVFGGDGNLYGTTFAGGNNGFGTAYKITTNGVPALTILASFGYTNGDNPATPLAPGISNNLFGTTYQGGTNDFGTVFAVTTNGSLTQLISFDGSNNGAYPLGGLVSNSDGYLYGTTFAGGATAAATFVGYGTAFKIKAANGQLTKLFDFDYYHGANPQGALVRGRDGVLYGTTVHGGVYSNGTVFSLTTNGALTTLVSFGLGNGASPCGGLVQSSNLNFYGATSAGGSTSNGTIFSVTTNGNLLTLFSFNGLNGSNPQAGLATNTDGNLYGTTFGGGIFGSGTVFKITPAGTLTTLVNFDYVNGANPQGVLVLGNDGNFYGTTATGGLYGIGTVFRLTPGGELNTLVSFNPGAGFPSTGLLQVSNVLYGATALGGPGNSGTLFGVAPTGTLSLLVSFNTAGAANPDGILALGADTNFYGTTFGSGAGSNNNGTIFRMSPTGLLTNLGSFTFTNGSHPLGGLLQSLAPIGLATNIVTNVLNNITNLSTNFPTVYSTNFYGTTSQGGPTDTGTVFKLTIGSTNTVVTTLAPFIDYILGEGAFPEGPLAQGVDSNIYGTTVSGGLYNYGTIFMVMTNGTLTTLHSFTYADGINPQTGLVLGSDGNFYGTTSSGGTNGYGTVFQFTQTNSTWLLNALVSFAGTNGSAPQGPLVRGMDGNFYGTTQSGGSFDYGTVFSLLPPSDSNTNWSVTNRVIFNGTNGAYPNAGLALGTDGNLYGTTAQGGAGGAGTLFSVWPILNCSQTGNQLTLSWSTNLAGFTLRSTTNLNPPVIWSSSFPPSIVGAQYVVTNTISGGNEFFRLIAQ